jgi:phosphinothricin acetyltransferase
MHKVPQIAYREARDGDLRHLVRIYNQAIFNGRQTADIDMFSVGDREEWFNELLSAPNTLFCVIDHDEIIGYFYFSPWRKGRRSLAKVQELSFYLSTTAQGMGIGDKILDWADDLARSLQFETLIAILLDINTRSMHLLEKHGFERKGHLPQIAHLKNQRISGQYIYMKKL